MTYSIDPELARWLPVLPESSYADVKAARAKLRAQVARWPKYRPPRPVEVRDAAAPGPDGAPSVPVRVYSPSDRSEPLPAVMYLHGGGFTVGDLDSIHSAALHVASEIGAVLVTVDYRLAPEHPFPAGLEDCYAALSWIAASAAELHIDPGRLAVAGDSAGGGLAAAVALLARDRGGPGLCCQYLETPQLDDRLDTPSMRAYHDTPLFSRSDAALCWQYYLGDGLRRGAGDVSPYAAPARARNLSGLPPAFVVTCEFDPLRDEGLDYAQRLVQAGVSTELHLYPGTFHGSAIIVSAAVSKRMAADKLDALRRGLR